MECVLQQNGEFVIMLLNDEIKFQIDTAATVNVMPFNAVSNKAFRSTNKTLYLEWAQGSFETRGKVSSHHIQEFLIFCRNICVSRPGLSSFGDVHKWKTGMVSL